MVYHSPFDLYYWFVNVFAGNITIFAALAFLFIAMLGAMFRMPTILLGVFIGLFLIMFSVYFGVGMIIIIMVILGIGLLWILQRLLR